MVLQITKTKTGYSTKPVRGSATFNPDMQTRMNEMDLDADETNEISDQINTVADEVDNNTKAAAQSVEDAQTEVGLAQGHRNKADEWANAAYTVQITPGKFSALHWSVISEGHSNKSKQWSEAPQHLEVAPNEYSAKHWALTAKNFADNLILDPAFSTSTTSIDVLGGVINLTTETGKAFLPDMWLAIISRADPFTWIQGFVVSYDSGTGAMVVSGTQLSGIGVFSDWLVTQTNPGASSDGGSGMTAVSMFLMDSM